MLIEQRLNKIRETLEQQKSATIEYLADYLNVSKDTVRRDLIKLEQKGLVRRIHGGVTLISREALIFNYQERSSQDKLNKEKMGEIAGSLIKKNSSVLLDSSTSIEAIIPFLSKKELLTITNSLTHAKFLATQEHEIIVLPGKLHKKQLFLFGSETVEKISHYHVDYTLLGIFAIDEGGMYIHTEEEGLLKRKMVRAGKKVIGIATHSKIQTKGLFKICSLQELDILITDEKPTDDFVISLQKNNVELIISKEEKL